jgi:hypothetical protein
MRTVNGTETEKARRALRGASIRTCVEVVLLRLSERVILSEVPGNLPRAPEPVKRLLCQNGV